MKRKLFALALVCASFLAVKYTAPVKKAAPALAFVGVVASMKKKGTWDGASDEVKQFAEAQDEAFKAEFKNYVALGSLDEKLKDLVKSVDEKSLSKEQLAEFKEVIDGYKIIAQEMKKLKDEGLGGNSKSAPLMTALKEGKANSGKTFDDFKKKNTQSLELEVKATQEATDIATHTIGVRVPGVGQQPVRRPFLMDVFRVVPCSTEFVKYLDQETVVRDAKNTYGITPTTHNTKVTWKERKIEIMKIRDFVYVSQDMLEDYDFVMGEINALLDSSVMLKFDDQILNGTGTGVEFHSISEYAGEFDATSTLGGTVTALAGTIQNPNVFDLCVAMASHVAALGKNNNYRPDTILWNSLDAFKSMLVKDKNDQYILPPFVNRVNDNEYTIHGMRVLSNPNVPANQIFLFDSSKGTIYMRRGFGIEMSYENKDNFETETVTVKGYVRANFFVRNVDINAFIKCTDVETALAALAEPSL